MSFANLVLVVVGTLSGLLAGVFYIFSIALVPAFRITSPQAHITTMQAINRKILNPLFMLSFLGPTALLPLAAIQHWGAPQFPLLVAAALLHIIGANGVTVVGNVPLNDRLDKVNVAQLGEAEAERVRQAFQGEGSAWMRFHHIRTLASIAAAALVLMVCLSKNSSQ
jgi:uncharacterized membrane protein